MTQNELLNFVKDFNQAKPILLQDVVDSLKKLDKKHHELYLLLVNYKNGKDFAKKITNEEI